MTTKTPIYRKSWVDLTPRQQFFRKKTLEILSVAKKSKQPLSKIAKNHDISLKTVITHTNAFKKQNGKWIPKKFDRISRLQKINENGKKISIEIRDSRTASTIGRYYNAEKLFLNTGDTKQLEKFAKKRIRDVNGVIHTLETDPQNIIKINERIESPEFVQVY